MANNLSITTKVFQALGNNKDGLAPALVKDTACNCAITYIYDKKASKQDGKERAVEEFGTEAVWIAGIPLIKKLFDKTIYKAKSLNPEFDVRNFSNNEGFDKLSWLAKNAKDEGQKSFLNNLKENKTLQSAYKKLHIAKFAVATAVPLALLSGLIVYKQKMTDKKIEKEVKEHKDFENALDKEFENNKVYESFSGLRNKKDKNVSFGSAKIAKFMSDFMYNPLKNQTILDAGITTTRLSQARKGEHGEVAFKELFTIGMYYVFTKPIQKGIEKISKKLFKTPIANEFQLLSNEKLPALLQKDGLKDSIKTLTDLKGEKQVLDYVYNNDNALVDMLKISGDLPTIKGSKGVIDSFKHIDTNGVQQTAKNISELLEEGAKQKDLTKFLSKVKGVKAASILANILIGVVAVGVIQPALTIMMRKHKNNGECENPAYKRIKEEKVNKV